ncbi:MAG: hypothetical protein OEM91_00215 [Hyphomicrobiales bacterium]|nr:hypothetical protein [Hyphomicrobiales bacterium]
MSAENSGVAERDTPARPHDTVQAMFFVTADADPQLCPRLVQPFAKLGLAPTRIHLSRENGSGEEISADLRVCGVSRTTAHLIDKALRRIIGVRSVIALVD